MGEEVREMAKQRGTRYVFGFTDQDSGQRGKGMDDRCVVAAGTPANRNELGTVSPSRARAFPSFSPSLRHSVFFFPDALSSHFYPFYPSLFADSLAFLSPLFRFAYSFSRLPSVRSSARPAFVLGLPNIWFLVIAPR